MYVVGTYLSRDTDYVSLAMKIPASFRTGIGALGNKYFNNVSKIKSTKNYVEQLVSFARLAIKKTRMLVSYPPWGVHTLHYFTHTRTEIAG